MWPDLSNRYLGVKNSNKIITILTLSPSLNLWCFLSSFGHLRAIPESFRSAAVPYKYLKLAFLLIYRPIVVFSPLSLPSQLRITRLYNFLIFFV